MIRVRPVGRLALFLALGGTSPCHAATEEAKAPDYLEWRLLNRNYFLYNDYRRADAGRFTAFKIGRATCRERVWY